MVILITIKGFGEFVYGFVFFFWVNLDFREGSFAWFIFLFLIFIEGGIEGVFNDI